MKNDEQPSPCPLPSVGEGKKTVYNGFERLPYHPNRHDRRKAAAIARKKGWKQDEFDPSVWRNESGEIYLWYSLPDYPNDIAAAWGLVEETNRRCWTVNVQREAEGATVFVTECGAVTHEPKKIWEFGDTAPLAISRAWLIWSEEVGG